MILMEKSGTNPEPRRATMTTEIESLEKKSILLGGEMAYAKRLIVALGDPRKWNYTGDFCDLGKPSGTCACGHMGIRYEFLLKHPDGRTAVVGSTCICHYYLINPEVAERMAMDYDSLMQKLADARKQAKKASDTEEVRNLTAQYNTAYDGINGAYKALKAEHKFAPRRMWELCAHYTYRLKPSEAILTKYKRACDQKRHLLAGIKAVAEVLGN